MDTAHAAWGGLIFNPQAFECFKNKKLLFFTNRSFIFNPSVERFAHILGDVATLYITSGLCMKNSL
jgi:hypothetical protein